MEQSLTALSRKVGERLRVRGEQITCAESCTGGLIAKLLTDIAGSSCYFERGFVTYSNRAKEEMLGVAGGVLAQHGAACADVLPAIGRPCGGRRRSLRCRRCWKNFLRES